MAQNCGPPRRTKDDNRMNASYDARNVEADQVPAEHKTSCRF